MVVVQGNEVISKIECTQCKAMLQLSAFFKAKSKSHGIQSWCKLCEEKRRVAMKNTLRGRLTKLIDTAKCATKQRKKQPHRASMEDVQVDLNVLLDKYEAQCGRCFYSGVRLSCKSGTEWIMSLERLDPKKGYTKDNTVLIALEFQTATQWSREALRKILFERE